MLDIRLRGLAGTSNGTNRERIEELTRFKLRRDGDDWIIPGDDPTLVRGPLDILRTTDKPRDLNQSSFGVVAEEYAENFLVEYFEERLAQPKGKVKIYGEWGIRTPLESHCLNFFLTPKHLLVERLVKETFPFLCSDQLAASAVAPVTLNADYQQAVISISKILAILEYGGYEKAKIHVDNQKGMNAVIPTPLDFLSYVEALNTMCPSAITLPMRRVGTSLHFMRGRTWFFPRLAVENIYEQLLGSIEPLATSEIAFFTKDQHFQKRALHSYFLSSVDGVNRLSRYLNDFRNFSDDDGLFDPMKMTKAHSVVRLMFADWQSINFTNSRYMKLRMVFAFLDKLANFLAIMRGGVQSEELLYKQLMSSSAGLRLAGILQNNFESRYYSLGRLMSGLAKGTYKKVHDHVSGQLLTGGDSEAQRLSYLRTLRNSAHGSFLRSSQFEEVFLAAGGTICMEFTFLPLLLLWGLVSDPKTFLEEI